MFGQKENLSEKAACTAFVGEFIVRALDNWPTVYANMRTSFGAAFEVDNEEQAALDWAFAYVGQEMQALPNVLPPTQAERIRRTIASVIEETSPEIAGYATSEVEAYGTAWRNAIERAWMADELMNTIPSRLLDRWLGHRAATFKRPSSGTYDPTLLLQTRVYLTPVGWWKMIADGMRLTQP